MPRENECKRNIYPRGKINVSAVIVVSRKQMEEEEGERRGVCTLGLQKRERFVTDII